jgi:hypothetical protein
MLQVSVLEFPRASIFRHFLRVIETAPENGARLSVAFPFFTNRKVCNPHLTRLSVTQFMQYLLECHAASLKLVVSFDASETEPPLRAVEANKLYFAHDCQPHPPVVCGLSICRMIQKV